MKKNLIGLLIILVLVSGCNYPGNTSTKTSGAVETQVAVLLTSMPTSTVVIAPTATLTSTPAVTATSTPAPTDTPTAVIPSPTATTSTSDPALSLGDPTWTNPSDWKGFYLEDTDANIHISQSNNDLVLTALKPNGWHGWTMTYQKYQNIYLEGTFTVGTCSGTDRYGLIFRAPDTSNGYFFGVTCDGQYSLRTWASGGFNKPDLISWTKSSQISAGSNQTNKLGIKVQGTHYSLYINGNLVDQADDDTYQNAGIFGAYISSVSTSNLTVTLSSLRCWQLQ